MRFKNGIPLSNTTLTVADDGVGFEMGKIDKAGHFGIAGMRERARMAGGSLR
jgi:two-component system sensor histidine kinase UhpB